MCAITHFKTRRLAETKSNRRAMLSSKIGISVPMYQGYKIGNLLAIPWRRFLSRYLGQNKQMLRAVLKLEKTVLVYPSIPLIAFSWRLESQTLKLMQMTS